MRIQHNIMAMNAYRNYTNNTSALSKNLEKLSSGYKINRAGDDAAGLAISEKMRAQITGLNKAQDNAKDGISLVQTAEGALTEVHDMLNRMVELATQSANGTYDNEVDRANLQAEMDQLMDEIDRIADSANFNGIKLLNGKLSAPTVTTTDGTNNGEAAAAVYELDLSGLSFTSGQTFTYAGVTITEGTTTGVTASNNAQQNASAIADAFNADGTFNTNYTASIAADGTTLVITAKNSGVDANSTTMTTAPSGTATGAAAITPQETTEGVDAGGPTAATTEIDFTNKTGTDVIGGTMTVGGTTYEFVENAADVTDGNTAIVVAKDAVAADIANAVNTALGTNVTGFTASVNGDVVKLTEDAPAGTTDAPEVKFGNMGLTLQIGDTSDDFNQLTVEVQDMHVKSLGIDNISIADQKSAQEAVSVIKTAINTVSSVRGNLGAIQNRLDHTINNLSVMEENIQDAESSIRDTDVAEEMMAYTKNNILVQSAQAMLAQANQVPQGVLQLLQ